MNAKKQTDAIADYWKERWLAKRIMKQEVLARVAKHSLAYPVEHGARVPVVNKDATEYLRELWGG